MNNFNDSQTLDGAQFPIGTTNVLWTAADKSGNTTECSFDVTVSDMVGTSELIYSGISVHPNPTKGMLYLDASGAKIQEVRVFDLAGSLLIHNIDAAIRKIDLSQLNSGLYIIRITQDNAKYTTSIVKE